MVITGMSTLQMDLTQKMAASDMSYFLTLHSQSAPVIPAADLGIVLYFPKEQRGRFPMALQRYFRHSRCCTSSASAAHSKFAKGLVVNWTVGTLSAKLLPALHRGHGTLIAMDHVVG
jgi:hypothetical protein